jgi:hypothetical protein
VDRRATEPVFHRRQRVHSQRKQFRFDGIKWFDETSSSEAICRFVASSTCQPQPLLSKRPSFFTTWFYQSRASSILMPTWAAVAVCILDHLRLLLPSVARALRMEQQLAVFQEEECFVDRCQSFAPIHLFLRCLNGVSRPGSSESATSCENDAEDWSWVGRGPLLTATLASVPAGATAATVSRGFSVLA